MSTQIERWMAMPLGVANRMAVISTVMAMAIVIVFDEPHPDGGTLLRGRAFMLALVHLLLDWGSRAALRAIAAREPQQGERALAAYRDARRISHLDMAAAWFGLCALAPYVARG